MVDNVVVDLGVIWDGDVANGLKKPIPHLRRSTKLVLDGTPCPFSSSLSSSQPGGGAWDVLVPCPLSRIIMS